MPRTMHLPDGITEALLARGRVETDARRILVSADAGKEKRETLLDAVNRAIAIPVAEGITLIVFCSMDRPTLDV
jgi:hypothetical protein